MEGDNDNNDQHVVVATGDAVDVHADADADADANDLDDTNYDDDGIINKLISVLQKRQKFPARQRKRKIVELSTTFLHDLEEDIHDMMKIQPGAGEGYDGLDDTKDTKEEAETALRFFPRVLSRRGGIWNLYPIQSITWMFAVTDNNKKIYLRNVKAVSFVDVLARLAIEFQSFQDNERGGILAEFAHGRNTLHYLVEGSNPRYDDDNHHCLVDNRFLDELIQLRRMNLIMKEDIRRYDLVNHLCKQIIFAPKRFQFLIEWDPSSLLQTDNDEGYTPLRWAALYDESIEPFRTVFDAGLRYFPNKEGIILAFRPDNFDETPFLRACEIHNRSTVMEAIGRTLAKYASTSPLNVASALLIAARDDSIHLDCVHFVMRRYPDLVVNLLHNTPKNTIIDDDDDNNNSNVVLRNGTNYQKDEDDDHNHDDVDGDNITTNENGGGGNEEHQHEINDTNTIKGRIRKRKREL